MRAAFNDVANVYFGPGTATPGALKFSAPCRLVPQTEIFDNFPPFDPPFFYITYEGPLTSAGEFNFTAVGYEVDLTKGDVWELASDPGVFYSCYDRDGVTPLNGDPYRRAFVVGFLL